MRRFFDTFTLDHLMELYGFLILHPANDAQTLQLLIELIQEIDPMFYDAHESSLTALCQDRESIINWLPLLRVSLDRAKNTGAGSAKIAEAMHDQIDMLIGIHIDCEGRRCV